MDGFVLSIDQGTSATKAHIFDRAGRLVSGASREVGRYYPQDGWVEADLEEIWGSVLGAVGAALKDARILPEDLVALGISNQQCTTAVWNRRSGEAIGRAIGWQDRRTQAICDRYTALEREEFARRSGCRLCANLSSAKLRWLLENDRAAQRALEREELLFGTMDSWLAWKLSGGGLHVTDLSNASNTGMLNIEAGTWDELILSKLGIPRRILPAIRGSSEVYGATRPELFFGAEVPIAACVGDQGAAAFGQACAAPGATRVGYGTGSFLTRSTGNEHRPPRRGAGTPATWSLGGSASYCIETFANVSGEAIRWLRDKLGLIGEASEADGLAIQVPDSGGVYFVPAMAGLQLPAERPSARGTVLGLGFGSTRQHLVRAALESIAFQVRDALEDMRLAYGCEVDLLRVDGGGSRSDFLMQFQADILGLAVERPAVVEASSLGAAQLAGLAVGFWASPEEAFSARRVEARFEPRIASSRREELLSGWLEAVGLAGRWKAGGSEAGRRREALLAALSPRELEVMRLFASGVTMRDISALLKTNIKTVEKQRRDAMDKLGVANLAGAVRSCLELGLVEPL